MLKKPHLNAQPSAAFLPESEDSTSALKRQDSRASGRLKSTPSAVPCSPTASPKPANSPMCAPACPNFGLLTSSSADSPAKTYPRWEKGADLPESEAGSSSMPWPSLSRSSPAGWYLKMSRGCSIAMLAKTFKSLSSPLPNAGMWDSGGCLMLVISESPRNAVASSLSQVWESRPPLSLWLMPEQWTQYLERLNRRQNGSKPILRCLPASGHPQSASAVPILSLSEDVGIRWLSGSECLQIMGFAKDWMLPTLRKLALPETPSVRRLRNGSPKN